MIKNDLIILTPNPFPIGNVASNRLSTYAVCLADHGYKVGVVVLKGTEDPVAPNNLERKGFYKKVWYEYMSKSPIWVRDRHLLVKIFLYLSGLIWAIAVLVREKPKSILLYSNDLFYMFVFKVVCLALGIFYAIDKSEYPVVYRSNGGLYKWLYLRSFRLFDGLLVMTKELEIYYSKIVSPRTKILRLPMTVDFERFGNVGCGVNVYGKYFGCVFGVHNRDCILDTVKAFDLFCDLMPASGIKLALVGDFENLVGRTEVQSVVDKSAHRDSIIFLGVLNAGQMPNFLINATSLITTPRCYISGGFPTKLGEYLASGKPVILTSVGEIPDFLTHGVDCLLAKPGDIEEVARLMLYVCNHLHDSINIGHRGKETASRSFNVEAYLDDLVVFFGLDS